MARTAFKWRVAGFEEVRKLPGVREEVTRRAERVAAAAGGAQKGYFVRSSIGKTRARAVVIAGTIEAIRSNAKHNTLLRSLDAGR